MIHFFSIPHALRQRTIGGNTTQVVTLGSHHRVGDTFKLGQSSRLYVVGGPEQLMPEEGLSREQRKQLRVMQVSLASLHNARAGASWLPGSSITCADRLLGRRSW